MRNKVPDTVSSQLSLLDCWLNGEIELKKATYTVSTSSKVFFDMYFLKFILSMEKTSPSAITKTLAVSRFHSFISSFSPSAIIYWLPIIYQGTVWNVMNIVVKEGSIIPVSIKFIIWWREISNTHINDYTCIIKVIIFMEWGHKQEISLGVPCWLGNWQFSKCQN